MVNKRQFWSNINVDEDELTNFLNKQSETAQNSGTLVELVRAKGGLYVCTDSYTLPGVLYDKYKGLIVDCSEEAVSSNREILLSNRD
jgi:hypothetical protein